MKYIYRFLGRQASYRGGITKACLTMAKVLVCISILYTNIATAVVPKTSSTMRVTANVVKFCTMKSTPFAFGRYGMMDLVAQSTITVTCTAGTIYHIGVSQPARAMTNNKNEILLYSVYQDKSKSKALGNAIKKNTISGTGTGKPEVITIYATIKGGQAVGKGSYSDMLNISLSF